jgi:hypothetical protein
VIKWWDEEPQFMSDAELIEAYERTSGEPSDTRSEALLKEIRRRELDL